MTRNEAHPLELAAVAAMALGWALWTVARLLLIPAAALLLLALGWRPATRAAAPQPQPVAPASAVVMACSAGPVAIAAPRLEGLTVAQLRRLARAAGLPRSLSHSGRRAQLLAALA